jgi:hypothetical protein
LYIHGNEAEVKNEGRRTQNRESEYVVEDTLRCAKRKHCKYWVNSCKQLIMKVISRYARTYFASSVPVVVVRMRP